MLIYYAFITQFQNCEASADGNQAYVMSDVWMLQDRDMEKALDGFIHAVQLDPDNGEAWNNLACLYDFFFLMLLSSKNFAIGDN